MLEVSIIVPTYNRSDILEATISSLLGQDFSDDDFEIIVVDDGSSDKTPDILRSFNSSTKHFRHISQVNSGVATARNAGAHAANGKVLIFNDDDIIAEPLMIRKHLRALGEYEKSLVNGHWEFTSEMKRYLASSAFGQFRLSVEDWVKTAVDLELIKENMYKASGVTACNLAINKHDFDKIGGFDQDFPYAGCEDQEFSIRTQRKGYKCLYNYNVQLWHNDQRLSLEQFGERQERGAVTKVLLAVKYPKEVGEHSLLVENRYLSRSDSRRIMVKKLSKWMLSSDFILKSLINWSGRLERVAGDNVLLRRLFSVICGIYIFRGIRFGLLTYGRSTE